MMFIGSGLVAYCFDRAVWLFGSTLDAELEESTHGCKDEKSMTRARMRVMDRWFPENRGAKGRFKDPAKLT
jgi:hypothetical protein